MEEQRHRQEAEQRRAQANSEADAPEALETAAAIAASAASAAGSAEPHSEEAMLERALALSTTETPVKRIRSCVRLHLVSMVFIQNYSQTKSNLKFSLISFFFLFFKCQIDDDQAMPDFSNMTEEEQIAFAMQMSMQEARKY
jgi:26S proteasome regulatory subunit N10